MTMRNGSSGLPSPVLFHLSVVWGVAGLLFASPANAGPDPPSLQDVIRKVNRQNRSLSKAEVQISPLRNAGDGGGRLYWKRGRYLHSRLYRFGAGGQLHLYEAVSDQNSTSFLFNTARPPDGHSFTFGLRMPFQKASQVGYGLSDYFLLSFAARGRVDVKYAGYLMALNLFPQRLRTFADRYEISFSQHQNDRFIVISRRVRMEKVFYFTEKIFLNPDTWRFEKVVFTDARRSHRLSVSSFQTVNGVNLPKTVTVTSPGFKHPHPYSLQYEVNTDGMDREHEKPNWIHDPGLPVLSDANTFAIHRKIDRKKIGPELYSDLMHAAIRYRYFISASHFHQRPFKKSVDQALGRHPDSRLLKAYDDSIRSIVGVSSSKEKPSYTSYPEIKDRVLHPYMNYAAAYRAVLDGNLRDARDFLAPVKDRFPYGRVMKRFRFLHRVMRDKDGSEFRRTLKKFLVGTPPAGHLGLVSLAVRILKKHKKWEAEVIRLAKEHPSPLVQLLLGRYFLQQDNIEKATPYFVQLSDDEYLENEVRSYLERAVFRAPDELIRSFEDRLTDVWLLVGQSIRHFSAGRRSDALNLVRKIVSLLRRDEEHPLGNPGMNPGEQKQNLSNLSQLLGQLNEIEQVSLARSLLKQVIRVYSMPWDHSNFLKTVRKITDESTAASYQVAKMYLNFGHTDGIKELLSIDAFRKELMKTVEEKEATFFDYLALSKAITFRILTDPSRVERAVSLLRDTHERFSSREQYPHLHNGIGDGFVVLEEFREAKKAYQFSMSSVLANRHPRYYETIFGSVPWNRVRSVYQEGTPDLNFRMPGVIKLALICNKLDLSGDEKEKQIDPFLRGYRFGGSPAMALFIIDRKATAIRYMARKFQKSTNRKNFMPLMQTLVGILKEERRYAEAALVYSMLMKSKRVQSEDIKKKFQKMQNRISVTRMIRELSAQDHEPLPEKKRRRVENMLEKMKRTGKKKTMKMVTRIIQMGESVIPVLLEHRNTQSLTMRKLIRNMLQNFRMRQIFQKLFRGSDEG